MAAWYDASDRGGRSKRDGGGSKAERIAGASRRTPSGLPVGSISRPF
jgi:hypothetical protein